MYLSEEFRLKVGLAEMLKGGVIMDVTNAEQARIAEQAGASAIRPSVEILQIGTFLSLLIRVPGPVRPCLCAAPSAAPSGKSTLTPPVHTGCCPASIRQNSIAVSATA